MASISWEYPDGSSNVLPDGRTMDRWAGRARGRREDVNDMSLTHDEQLRLNEIELHLRSSDPAFTRRLDPSFDPSRDHRVLIRCILLLVVGTSIMVAGAAGVTGVFSYGTVFALLGVGVMTLAIRRMRSLNPPPAAATAQ